MPPAAVRHDPRSVLLENSSVCFTLSPTAIATTDRHNVLDNFGTLSAVLDWRDRLSSRYPAAKGNSQINRARSTHVGHTSSVVEVLSFADPSGQSTDWTAFGATGTEIAERTNRVIAVDVLRETCAMPS
jgi:hypothetical protein